MKKATMLIFGFILISKITMYAQNVQYGIIAGFDVANSNVTNKIELPGGDSRIFYPMIAYNANGFIQHNTFNFLQFSLEPGLILKGGKVKGTESDAKFKLTYIQLPVIADFRVSEKIFISTGPEFSYMIRAKLRDLDISDIYNERFEISGIIGINYKINDKFDIGIRYNHGFTYTSKIQYVNDEGRIMGDAKEYNQYFQLRLRHKI